MKNFQKKEMKKKLLTLIFLFFFLCEKTNSMGEEISFPVDDTDDVCKLLKSQLNSESNGRFSKNSSIAVASKWIELTNQTKFDARSDERKIGIAEFCGFFEAHARIEIPEWFRKSLINGVLEKNDQFFWPSNGKSWINFNSLWISSPHKILQRGADLIVIDHSTKHDVSLRGILNAIYENESQHASCFSIAVADVRTIISPHLSKDEHSFPDYIYCLDEDDKLLWKSSVSNYPSGVSLNGPSGIESYSELAVNEDTIAIFGLQWDSMYINVYNLSDGTVRLRFATSFSGNCQ